MTSLRSHIFYLKFWRVWQMRWKWYYKIIHQILWQVSVSVHLIMQHSFYSKISSWMKSYSCFNMRYYYWSLNVRDFSFGRNVDLSFKPFLTPIALYRKKYMTFIRIYNRCGCGLCAIYSTYMCVYVYSLHHQTMFVPCTIYIR